MLRCLALAGLLATRTVVSPSGGTRAGFYTFLFTERGRLPLVRGDIVLGEQSVPHCPVLRLPPGCQALYRRLSLLVVF